MRVRALLIVLLASIGSPAADRLPSLADVENLETEFAALASRMDAALAELEDLRRAFPTAPDKAAKLDEAARRLKALGFDVDEMMHLRTRHRKLLHGFTMMAFSKGMV